MTRLLWTLLILAQAPLPPLAAQDRPRPYPVVPPSGYQLAVHNGTRSATGQPGQRYWQQWTSYTINARLDTEAKRLDGGARIVYHNNAPDRLAVIHLHLLQNLHAEGAARNEPQEVTGGVTVRRVAVAGRTLPEQPAQGPGYFVSGTIMSIRLPSPVFPGDSVRFEIEWTFAVPRSGSGRMGWSRDSLFHIAYWYPHVAVYDDVVGWQLDPYLGNAEFYAGFGRYDVTLDVPEGWVVRGTGRHQNATDVLTPDVLARLRAAERSDTVVPVLRAGDFGPGRATRTAPGGRLRWRFVADTVRDFAFSATRGSLWDATRTPVGDRTGDGVTDYARIETLYRADAPRWTEAWRYAQHSIDFLSRWTGFPYPWPHMTAVEAGDIISGGMEFPMLTLIGDYNRSTDSALYYVTAHELAHMWVPMIVGTDEKRYAWMDEGTTSFNENRARQDFYPGIDHDEPDRGDYIQVARSDHEGEMMRWSDYHYPGPGYVTASYRKPATVLAALRGLVGDDVFRRGLNMFINDWAYRHPYPWDLFRTFNTVSGQDLDWFWRSWYYETWVLDQAIGEVRQDGDAGDAGDAGERTARRTTITVEDRGLVPMPARLTITLANGQTVREEVPVTTWLDGATSATVTVSTTSPVVKVEIDAEGVFPDADRRNNVWERR